MVVLRSWVAARAFRTFGLSATIIGVELWEEWRCGILVVADGLSQERQSSKMQPG